VQVDCSELGAGTGEDCFPLPHIGRCTPSFIFQRLQGSQIVMFEFLLNTQLRCIIIIHVKRGMRVHSVDCLLHPHQCIMYEL